LPEASGEEAFIRWDEERMTTGVATIDAQHQELISRLNQLHNACRRGAGKEELRPMLDFLARYAQEHFGYEEDLMEKTSCPSKAANRAAHLKFLREFEEVLRIFNEGNGTTRLLLALKTMVADWLESHICSVDTHLRGCQQKCGAGHRRDHAHPAPVGGG
jgi:hemerythrin-like metal-binding protein